jgi:hypothetical protein
MDKHAPADLEAALHPLEAYGIDLTVKVRYVRLHAVEIAISAVPSNAKANAKYLG